MTLAQRLYEAGLITYPRTDSTHTAPESQEAARQVIIQMYGKKALASSDANRSQLFAWLRGKEEETDETHPTSEAHEAIRPSDPARMPDDLKELQNETLALYRLIWQRFIASQMRPARFEVVTVAFERVTQ